jgi:predicted regulator of amino acid metabolism with ACT domain
MDVESSIKALGNEALRDLYNNLIQVKAFAIEQAPDVCRQIIAWEIAQGVTIAVVACVITWLFFRKMKLFKAACDDMEVYNRDGDVPVLIVAVLLGFASAISVIFALVEGAESVKAIVAPKLVLIEYIAKVIK